MKRLLDKYFSNALLDNITDLLLPYNLKLIYEDKGKVIKVYFKPRHWKEEDAPFIFCFMKSEAVKMMCNWSNSKVAITDMIIEFQKEYRY